MVGGLIKKFQRASRFDSARGMSLLEILIVIVIVAALSGLALSFLSARNPATSLRHAGANLAAELRFVRLFAISSGSPQQLTLHLRERRWEGPLNHHGLLPKEADIRVTGPLIEQNRSREVNIRFFPDGASTGGRIDLQLGQAIWRLDVIWATGEVQSHAIPVRS